ncbi:MAG: hypothetical protein QM733_03640 [Ilumatobacteraceae bacterium]
MKPTVATRRSTDQLVHRDSVTETLPAITRFLTDLLGVKLVAHIVDKEPGTVRRWEKDANTPGDEAERRLRTTAQIARTILEAGDAGHVVRAWFIGMNPQLADEAPADVIRNDRPRDALAAARAFAGTA